MVQFLPSDDASEVVHRTGRTAVHRDGTMWRAGYQVGCACDEELGLRCQYHYPPDYPRVRSGPFGTAALEGSVRTCEYWHITGRDGTHRYAFFSDDVQEYLDTGVVTASLIPQDRWDTLA